MYILGRERDAGHPCCSLIRPVQKVNQANMLLLEELRKSPSGKQCSNEPGIKTPFGTLYLCGFGDASLRKHSTIHCGLRLIETPSFFLNHCLWKYSTIHCGLRLERSSLLDLILVSLKAFHDTLWIAAYGCLLGGSVMPVQARSRRSSCGAVRLRNEEDSTKYGGLRLIQFRKSRLLSSPKAFHDYCGLRSNIVRLLTFWIFFLGLRGGGAFCIFSDIRKCIYAYVFVCAWIVNYFILAILA